MGQADMNKPPAQNVLPRAPSEINLANVLLNPELRVLLLTAANAGHGTTTSALALAGELTNASHEQVLLMDASLAANNLTKQTGLAEHPGFLDLMQSEAPPELSDCIQTSSDLPCHFIPLGNTKNREQRPTPDLLQQLFDQLRARYRFVVIDGDAIYAPGDTLVISTLADGVVLVIRAEETRWEVAQAAMLRLNQVQAKLIGSVFNARRYYVPKWVYNLL